MITKEQAMNLNNNAVIHHISDKNRDGTPVRWRVNGKCKIWKTRPEEFSLPIKYGLKVYGKLTHKNCDQFVMPE